MTINKEDNWDGLDRRAHERIDELQQRFIDCNRDVHESINSFTETVREMKEDMAILTAALSNESIKSMIKDYTDKQGFYETSNKWGKRIILVAGVGGALSSIFYIITHWKWPPG